MRYVPELVKRISDYPIIVIYGARIVAREVAGVLTEQPYGLKVSCFMVSEKAGNPNEIMGIPVHEVDCVPESYKNGLVIIACLEKYVNSIIDGLYRRGSFNILPLTFESDIWSEIRGNSFEFSFSDYFDKEYLDADTAIIPRNKTCGELHVYRAISHLDKAIYEKEYDFSWEIPIQVGKALTDKKLSELNDAMGIDTISERNSSFCELTALYWIWKNDKSNYKGLCHYRRHFLLNEEQRRNLLDSDVDVILTIPIYNTPDVYNVYANDHIENDWKVMMDEIQKQRPEYMDAAKHMAVNNWYYAYNMVIARNEIFDDYCEFLFPILFACEKRIGNREIGYQGRYAGFLAERLMSIYFMKHKEYKLVHCKKHFISY